jgi:predicted alpha/beta-hydrolase family hydrolase
MKKICLFLLFSWSSLLGLSASAATDGELLHVATRPGVVVPVFWHPLANAGATLVLLPGGDGGIGGLNEEGWPSSRNFLIRSGKLFAQHGFNVAMVSHPSDVATMDYPFRISDAHLQDLHQVLIELKSRSAGPLWLVGTSRGTVSATAAVIAERDPQLIAGLVLTSSITNYKKPGAIPRQELSKIQIPVLVMHHAKDACNVCQPQAVPLIMAGLTNSPIKRQIMVDGGSDPSGSACEAEHWHGYIGMESEAVDLIANWIKQPRP